MTFISQIIDKVNFRKLASTVCVITTCCYQSGLMANPKSELLAFKNVNLLEPSIELPITNSTLLVEDGKILKILPNTAALPTNAKVIDLDGGWALPGLIDGLIHLAQSGGAFTRPDIIDASSIKPYQDEQLWLLKNQQKLLSRYMQLGITTVFDLGGPTEYLPAYQQLSKQQDMPEIFYAGALLSPMNVPKLEAIGATFSKVSNEAEAKRLVQQQLKQDTHILKIVWTLEAGNSPQELFNMYQPAIKLAKDQGLVVAIHVESLADAKWAVKVGADILIHGVMREAVDDELINLMLSNKITYMPTLTVFEHYFELLKGSLTFNEHEQKHANSETLNSFEILDDNWNKLSSMLPIYRKYLPFVDESDEVLSSLTEKEQSIVMQLKSFFSNKFISLQKANLKKVADSGVNVAVGTDAGNMGTLHGSSLVGEMLAWKSAGFSNQSIIKATTLGNAIAFNLTKSLGSLTATKQADFIVLAENPYKNFDVLMSPSLVVKKGKIIFNKSESVSKTLE